MLQVDEEGDTLFEVSVVAHFCWDSAVGKLGLESREQRISLDQKLNKVVHQTGVIIYYLLHHSTVEVLKPEVFVLC